MNLKESLKVTKLDLTNLVFMPGSGSGSEHSKFEISPKDFLRFSKLDFHSNNSQGLINSLTNAKRAIDCQIDETLSVLGIDFQDIPKQSEEIVSLMEFNIDLPYKLKLIQALNLAPAYIVAKARTLRNKLEHYYNLPSKEEVQESIDIAELFIRSIEGKTKILEDEFYITDSKNRTDLWEFNSGLSFGFDKINKSFRIIPTKKKVHLDSFKVDYKNVEYYGLLRLMLSIDDDFECLKSLQLIMNLIEHEIPINKIKVECE
ncbi:MULTISPECIES: hypothetical protein [Hwangdonia]|uniref:Uncharacterized protein n=1 Tax=Hwangdonia seohaensis TaxID=1240727 RepID=A0ABW3RA55_9FLAO|nr:hypothetical protein [Hwangdonia seohaensis]